MEEDPPQRYTVVLETHVPYLFTPLAASTMVLTTNPGYGNVPDIAFAMKDLETIFDEYGLSYRSETFATQTQYGVETIIYLEKKDV
jgi:hypothetical protein